MEDLADIEAMQRQDDDGGPIVENKTAVQQDELIRLANELEAVSNE